MDDIVCKFIEIPYKRVSLCDKDAIVLEYPQFLSPTAREGISRQCKVAFPDKRIVLLEGGLKLSVLSEVEIRDSLEQTVPDINKKG